MHITRYKNNKAKYIKIWLKTCTAIDLPPRYLTYQSSHWLTESGGLVSLKQFESITSSSLDRLQRVLKSAGKSLQKPDAISITTEAGVQLGYFINIKDNS